MKKSPRVSIIVLNWNGWKDTVECLRSLGKIAYPNYEVVVVDNGSTDDSRRHLKNFRSRALTPKFIFNKKNLGFAGGNNTAIRRILKKDKSDYILLLNNDTVVDKDFLGRLVKVSREEKRAAILGPKIYYYRYKGKRDVIQSVGCRVNLYLGKFPSVEALDRPDTHQINKPQSVDFVTGACLLIKTKVIKRIGLLNEEYFLLFEDTDWCLRAKKAGYSVWYVPKSIVWHKTSRSFKNNRVSQVYYYTRNLFWLEFEHARLFQLLLFLFYYFIFILPKYFLGYIFIKKDRRRLAKYLGGVGKGIFGRRRLNRER